MIKATVKSVKIEGTSYEIGVTLTNIFAKVYQEYGLDQGQKLIDEALNLAVR